MNLANRITCVRLILIPLFIFFVTPKPEWMAGGSMINSYSLFIAVGIFVIAVLTDKLDGYVARKYNQVTKLGCFLDPLADKLLIIAALLYLVEENRLAGWIALIIVAREIAVTGLRLAASMNRKVLSADKYGKIKLVLQAVTITLYLLSCPPIGIGYKFHLDEIMMFLTVAITIYSGFNYFKNNKEVFYDNGKLIL